MFRMTLCLCLTFAAVALSADVTVELNSNAEETNNRLELKGLFEGAGSIEGKVMPDGKKIVFTVPQEGAFALVLWQKSVVWAPSPDYDKTIFIGQQDVVVRPPERVTRRKIKLVLPRVVVDRVETDHSDRPFVPCRLQRIEDGVAWPYAFRWILLERTSESFGYIGEMENTPGSYTLTIPQRVGTMAILGKYQPATALPHPLVVVPVNLDKEGKFSNPFREIGMYLEWETGEASR